MRRLSLFLVLIVLSQTIFSQIFKKREQQTDKAVFIEFQPGYYHNFILRDVSEIEERLSPSMQERRFFMDHSGLELPNRIDLYDKIWANPVVSQGNAGTCWAYGGVSFFESEIKRQQDIEIKLSEIFIVYHEYVERARRFVQERGESLISEGSQTNAVTRMIKIYGIVPESEYTGLLHGRKYHSHAAMFKEIDTYLKYVEKYNIWDEEHVVSVVKSILNHHIGEPPTEFTYNGIEYTPRSYADDYLKIKTDDYIDVISLLQKDYGKYVAYPVPDNWWKCDNYYNVNLERFMQILNTALDKGYTVSIGGDVSEAGFSRTTNVAMIPKFDIPSEYIDEYARQFRLSNKSTTDDHIMHIVGQYKTKQGRWYLVKDSSSGSRNIDKDAPEFGYYFMHEDYIKLKILTFTVHRDIVKQKKAN